MEKLMDAIVTMIIVVGVTAGGRYVLRETFLWVRKAALEKSVEGLPPSLHLPAVCLGIDPELEETQCSQIF